MKKLRLAKAAAEAKAVAATAAAAEAEREKGRDEGISATDADIESPDQRSRRERQLQAKAAATPSAPPIPLLLPPPAAAMGPRQGPTHILFLPPHVATRPAFFKWPTWLFAKYSQRKTFWLFVIWALLMLLAIGLLVGLLVPWNKGSSPPPSFSSGGSLLPIGTAGSNVASFQVWKS
jgi:hypothetical protein